jgi:phospholipase C
MVAENGLSSVEHIVVLMLENRSFDHMLGFLYTDQDNVSPSGQPYAGLTGSESNPDPSGQPVTVFRIEPAAPSAYFMPGAIPARGTRRPTASCSAASTARAIRRRCPAARASSRTSATRSAGNRGRRGGQT